MGPSKQPPMLDYVTKLMLLEVVKATVERDVDAAIWIEATMTNLYYRWRELDELKK
jgi:hypothetical protein